MRARSVALALGIAGVAVVGSALPAAAHPLGNFTINVYAGIVVQPDRLLVDYVVDMAEIPTYQERSRVDANGDGRIDAHEKSSYAERTCTSLADGVEVAGAGELRVERESLRLVPGAAGLPTLRLQCDLVASTTGTSLRWSDGNFAGRAGWHEVTANGDRTTLTSSDVPRTSASTRLSAYPRDLLSSPLSQRTATLRWRDGGPAYVAPSGTHHGNTVGSVPLAGDPATRWYTALLERHAFGGAFAIVALLLSVLLGALHGLAPGHGKTVMAAYLLGRDGRMRDGLAMALSVTLTHTAGVLLLGLGLASATAWAPERVYPWLSLASGLLIVGVAATLLRSHLRRRTAMRSHGHGRHHDHDHDHGHDPVHDHGHDHPHPHQGSARPDMRSLVVLGLAGGLVPSPSAVIVLLGALAVHRVWFGVLLVVGYGIGMALVLVGAGLLLLRSRSLLLRTRLVRSPRARRWAAALPMVSAGVVAIAGLAVVARSSVQL